MQNTNVEIFDSTLRDGAQSEGITFSVNDKLAIARLLDSFGVAYIEAGNPGSNPKDAEFFAHTQELNLEIAQLVAFGSTRRKGIHACDDANVKSLLDAHTNYISIFGKSWDLHVEHILLTTLDENLAMIHDTVAYLTAQGKHVFYDAEHFFDGYRANPEYAIKTIQTAAQAGAERIVLCDTNGGTFPSRIAELVKVAIAAVAPIKVGIHAHNDTGLAVAVSITAVEAGARHVQGTFIGYGERCGNANLSTIIPDLQLHADYACVPNSALSLLVATSKQIAEISNIKLDKNMPYVGASAFTHKAGMHADGVLKVSTSFEHINPSIVGNARHFVMSEVAGRTAIAEKMKRFFPAITKDTPELVVLAKKIKKLEHDGYTFESAEHSLALEMCKALGTFKSYFEVISYSTESTSPSLDPTLSATATVKIKVQDKTQLLVAEGDGPIHALDLALRKCLEVFFPTLARINLIDYKVRVLDSKNTTGSSVRVVISSTDGYNEWSTVGVSTDIIKASFKALTDSTEVFLLMLDGIIFTDKK